VARRGFAELSNIHQIKNRLMQDPYVLYTFEMVDSAFFFFASDCLLLSHEFLEKLGCNIGLLFSLLI